MESLFLLIPLSLVLVGLAIWFFLRMSESGQFDDMEGPAHSILMDDDRPRPPPAAQPTPSSAPAGPAGPGAPEQPEPARSLPEQPETPRASHPRND